MKSEMKRTQFVDMMKGLAILWVVLFHLLGPGPVKNIFIQSIDVALVAFFLFSGYFHRPGKKTIGQNLKSRAKALLIPFFKYSLFFWVAGTLYLISTGTTTLMEALCCLRNFFGGCIWNRTIQQWFNWDYHNLGSRYPFLADFWFLIAMMLASILFFLIIDLVIQSKAKTLIAAAVLFAITGVLRGFDIALPYNLQLTPFWTGTMVLGAFAGQYKLFENDVLTGAKEWILAILSLAAGAVISALKPANPNMFRGGFPKDNEVVGMLLCIASSLLIIWGLGIIFKKIEKAGVRVRELAWLGSHSLLIYLYHMFFAWILCTITGFPIRYPEEADAAFFWKSVLLTLACLALCILRYVFADVITGKLSKDPAVWSKARTVTLSVVFAGIALAAGFMGLRGAQEAEKARAEANAVVEAESKDTPQQTESGRAEASPAAQAESKDAAQQSASASGK